MMQQRPTRIYLETSAVNFLYSLSPGVAGAQATKAVHQLKGNTFYISPVTLWEVLLISDEMHREEMLTYCANLCEKMLPKTPAELLLDHLVTNGEHVIYNDFSTACSLKAAWEQIHNKADRTIIVEQKGFRTFSNVMKRQAKSLDSIINTFLFDGAETSERDLFNTIVGGVYEQLNFPNKNVHQMHIAARRIAILLVFLILCLGVDISRELIEAYWAGLGIEDPIARLSYLVTRHPTAFYSGPITFMAGIVSYQHKRGKTNRGALHDGLHCGYLQYFDLFLTSDGLLAEMVAFARPEFEDVYGRIQDISKLDYTLREIKLPAKED